MKFNKHLNLLAILIFASYFAWLIPQVVVAIPMTSQASEPIQQTGAHSGLASWYDYDLEGYPEYSKHYRTCASRYYPRGTILRVIYQDRFTTCRVNDFCPEEWTGRDIDLSSLAFRDLAPLSMGVVEVKIIR